MNPSSFFKKKQENGKSVTRKTVKQQRVDTEAGQALNSNKHKSKVMKTQTNEKNIEQKTQKIQRYTAKSKDINNQSKATVYPGSKTTLYIKQLGKTLCELKNRIQAQYEQLLNKKISPTKQWQISRLLSTNYFRFRKANFYSVLNQYSKIIQGFQILISKLKNNQKLSDKVIIKNQQQFVLFFKFFFSKPYNLINLPSVRKIVKLLWDQFIFNSLTIQAMIKNLRLWIFGISAPLNPTMNKLHQLCTQKYAQISKLITHKSNSNVYIGVNDSDCLCLTPIMVAVICKNTKAVDKLIKNGADLYCCPITVNSKKITQSIQQSKFGRKYIIKKDFGIKQRRQANIFQILRAQKRLQQIATYVIWQQYYKLKQFRKNSQLNDIIEMMPNCSFQIDWKQYRGILCFKQLPQDIISVYKKGNSIRIDFHIKDLDNSIKTKGHYSIILKASSKEDTQLFLINHNEKKIKNVFEDSDLQLMKKKYLNIINFGNIYNYDIKQLKALYFTQQNRLNATISSYYQNLLKFQLPVFKNQKQYIKQSIRTQLINYDILQKDQIKAILYQNIAKSQKCKNKVIQSDNNIQIQWKQQHLNYLHLDFILKIALLVFPQSVLLHKISTSMSLLQDPLFYRFNFLKKLPIRVKYSAQNQANLQCQIKNIKYGNLQQAIFKIEIKAKQMKYQQSEQPVSLSHLQDTLFVDQMYSISASRFMGKSQKILQMQDQEVNRKFQQLLKLQGIWSDQQQQQK